MPSEQPASKAAPPAEMRIGVAFLARGFHPSWQHAFQRFVTSYKNFPTGIPHRLYVIYKGYHDAEHLAEGQSCFADLPHTEIHTDDSGFDIGCYQRAARDMREELVCFLNTKSEVLCANWLRNLAKHLARPGVGLVGNTGSYESLHYKIPTIPQFPNPHIRTNAFLIRRTLFTGIAARFDIRTKTDGWMFESGPDGLSRQVVREGLQLLVVGRAGKAYESSSWPESNTYRTANAAPLIGDDTYREFLAGDPVFRRDEAAITWGTPAEEAQVRASYTGRPETEQRDSLSRTLIEKPPRPLKRFVRALIKRAHSPA